MLCFDEHVFPFAALHPNAGRRLHEEILLLPSHAAPLDTSDRGVHTNHYLQIVPVTNPSQVQVGDSPKNYAPNKGHIK
jgi:hypothetical protein